uniref:PLxRFG domain-containing protein n=2 Tax=Aromatoleum anaerobium TaxID=182180 RepID=A0ABX1PQV5_9RHOO
MTEPTHDDPGKQPEVATAPVIREAIAPRAEQGKQADTAADTNEAAGQERVQFSRAGATEFVPSPDGSIDFGEITSDMAQVMRRQPGKIRLERGDDSYGERHIELRHGKDIRALGFRGAAEFVADIAKHIDQVWQPGATSQLVAIHQVSNDRVMFVELRQAQDESGDYYTVRSAFPARSGFVNNKGWKVLWGGRAQPSIDSGSSIPFAAPTPRSTGESATIPSGQSTDRNVADGIDDGKEARASVTARATTPDAIRSAIASLVGPFRKGRIIVVQSAAELVEQGVIQSRDAAGAQAFVKDGKAYFIADNIRPGNERAVFLHEVGEHLGMEKILSPFARKVLLTKIRNWSQESGTVESRIAKAALRRVEAAGETGSDSETLAYFVEEAVKAGIDPTAETQSALGKWFAQFMAAVRKALESLGLVSPKQLTAQDVVNLAHGAAKVAMSEDGASDYDHIVVNAKPPAGLPESGRIGSKASDDSPTPPFAGGASSINDQGSKIKPSIQFSRAATLAPDAESVSAKARDFLADVVKRPGVFGPLARTLQTQYHKSTKNPLFKAVWTRAHAMFMDSSRAMSRPAELAPNLLPKFDLSNIRDAAKAVFGRGQTERADLKAVADVLSAGTLYDGAGPMNGVVFTEQHLRDGVKVGDRFVKLTDKQIDLYRQARAALDASLDEAAAGEAWGLLRRHTDNADLRTWIAENPQDASRAMGEALYGVLEQEQQNLEDAKLRAAEMGDDRSKAAVTKQEGRVADIQDTADRITAIFDKAARLKEAGYMPLMRFGQYRVAVTSQDESGKRTTEYVSRYESAFEANRARRQLLQDFPAAEGFTVGEVEVTNPDEWKMYQGVNPETLMLFAKESGIAVDDVMQSWYKEATSSRSAMRRMVHRKGYQGFSDDLPRVLASFITSNGKRAGYAYHLADMQQMLQDESMPGDVQQEAQKLLETITEPTDKGGNVRGLMATWYLLGSAASAAVNATQTLTMSLPFLSQFGVKGFAPGEAMGHLARAYSMAFGKIKDAELADAVKRAEEAGIVDSNEVFHLYAESMKPLISKLGSGGLAYRARAFMTLWGAPFAIVEKLNRKSTFIAAYNMAKAQGKDMKEAYEFGERAVVETQGVYAKHNRPNWARGNVGGAILVFRQFSIAYLELAARMWQSGPEGKKAAALMLGILFATAGLAGMPGEDDLLDLIDTFSQVFFGKATISKMELRNHLHDMLGKELGEFVNSGVSAFLPLDVSGRMGMGNLLPGTAAFKPSEANKEREALEVLGVPGSFALSAMKGAQLLMAGNATGAAKAFAPKAVQDAVKGVEMARTGEARDMAGRKIVDVDIGDALIQMAGFNPTVKAEAGRKAFEVNELIGYNKRMEAEIVGKMARGISDRDTDAVRSAQEELANWNHRNPDAPILINARQVQHRIRQLQMERSGRIVKLAPPELRRRVEEALDE